MKQRFLLYPREEEGGQEDCMEEGKADLTARLISSYPGGESRESIPWMSGLLKNTSQVLLKSRHLNQGPCTLLSKGSSLFFKCFY